jgi:hypothetical protein
MTSELHQRVQNRSIMRCVHQSDLCGPQDSHSFRGATVWKQAHWGGSKPQSGPATAAQRESAGLRIIGMTALMSRTREAGSKTAATVEYVTSFRDPFTTSSWRRKVHIHRIREGNSVGGAAAHAQTRSRCQRGKAHGPIRVGNPGCEPHPMLRAPVAMNPICDKRTPSTNKHCFQMYLGPCSTKKKETPQIKRPSIRYHI